MEILFVCTGNLCRSPMAAAMLQSELARRGVRGVRVSSAGTWAGTGNPATPDAVAVLRGRDIDLSRHRSRPLDPEEVERADLVVVMTSVHEREVLALCPEAAGKVVLLKELAEMKVPADARDPGARVRGLLASPRPERLRRLDLDDPMGLPLSSYGRCAGEIEAGVLALADALTPP
ncbi:MAG TPA: low molecular weight phosphotyrosine protein phosphatase [Actinomycetota bacterium]|nr:low molecular weight phosphotyrosine protein phosphatase [Actinomycetota bacterium]